MRDREQEPKQYFCVSTARLVPHFVRVFLLLRPQIKAALKQTVSFAIIYPTSYPLNL